GDPAQTAAYARPLRQSLGYGRVIWPPGKTCAPLEFEQPLPVADQRPFDRHHGFMPGTLRLVRQPEFIGGASTANVGQTLVHQQALAMVTVESADTTTPAQRVVPAHLHLCLQQLLPQTASQSCTTVGIEQTTHAYSARTGTAQCLDQALAALAILDQIQFQ